MTRRLSVRAAAPDADELVVISMRGLVAVSIEVGVNPVELSEVRTPFC